MHQNNAEEIPEKKHSKILDIIVSQDIGIKKKQNTFEKWQTENFAEC